MLAARPHQSLQELAEVVVLHGALDALLPEA